VLERHIARLDDARFATPAKKCRYLIGQVMREVVGRAEGRRVVQRVHAKLGVPQSEPARVEAQA